jgi:oligopeptide/dipeptide ABC transporter ATP-binding protein
MPKEGTLLNISGLKVQFFTEDGIVRAVDGVDLRLGKDEAMGLMGESGSGKTMTALSVLRLVPYPGKIVQGEIWFDGKDLMTLSKVEIRRIRGRRIAMSFQDPMTYLNPVMKVGQQIAEAIMLHQESDRLEAMKKAVEVMEMMEIPSANERARDYPHQLSGGMRQRVLLAMTISCNPELLIVDEPTTALDTIVQAEICELFRNLKRKMRTAILLITHDPGLVVELCSKVAVMYAGRILECGDIRAIFKEPAHPYTKGLLASIPRLDRGKRQLTPIEGWVPDLSNLPPGCRFNPRCPLRLEICREQEPQLVETGPNHSVACHLLNKRG